MSEFEDKLNAILSSPETMAQIMNLADSLNGNEETAQGQGEEAPTTEKGADNTGKKGLGDLLGGIDPSMVARIMPLLKEYQSGSDEKTALLGALRPFLSESRQGKVERAIQITRLSRVIRGSMRLFRGDDHV